MLNKLLKRCMPWMDKGRWYKLVLKGTGTDFIVDDDLSDQLFYNSFAEFDVDNKMITIKNPGAVFWENKCTIEYNNMLIGVTLDLYSAVSELFVAIPTITVNVQPLTGIKLTLWMFGR